MASPLRRARLRRSTLHSTPSPPRCIASYSHAKAQVQSISRAQQQAAAGSAATTTLPDPLSAQIRRAAVVNESLSPTYFEATGAVWMPLGGGKEPVDPNKAKLGKSTFLPSLNPSGPFARYFPHRLSCTPPQRHGNAQHRQSTADTFTALRILQERMPTLLQSPLPQAILAPNISLQLFPSTHPHLPTVSGRVAYNAALWTSPIAWNRVPIIGNVRLEILAERMTAEPLTFLPRRHGAMAEQLVVRWCEKRKTPGQDEGGGAGAAIARSLRLSRNGVDPNKAFTGLFIFDFDAEGRVLTHTIETAQEGGNWERGVGAKFVGLTDWLLGGIRDPGDTSPTPMFERRRRS